MLSEIPSDSSSHSQLREDVTERVEVEAGWGFRLKMWETKIPEMKAIVE